MLSVVNEHHRFMDRLQLLNGRVQVLEQKAGRLNYVVLAKDSSITDLKLSLSKEIEAGKLCEDELDETKRNLRKEKIKSGIFGGTTGAAILVIAGILIFK